MGLGFLLVVGVLFLFCFVCLFLNLLFGDNIGLCNLTQKLVCGINYMYLSPPPILP